MGGSALAPRRAVCVPSTGVRKLAGSVHSLRCRLVPGASLCLCSLQGFKDNLHAVFCLAENSVGPNATRPDDIHLLYSGK